MVRARRLETGTWEYVLKEDRDLPEDERTVWILQRLPQRALVELADATDVDVDHDTREVKTTIRLGTQNEIALRHGLVGCRNFLDESGEEIAPRPNGERITPSSFFARMDMRWQSEIANQILQGGGPLTREEVGKPAPSPTT